MRNLKKVLSLALALVMLVGMMVIGAGAVDATEYPDYGDVSANKQEAMQVITALSVMDGTDKGLEPTATLTRAMAATIITRALLGRDVADALSSSTCVFTDVTADWAKGAIQYCADMGIVNGVGNNMFAPNSPVKGTEFAAMLLRAVDPDGDYVGETWASKVIVAANKNGLSKNIAVTATELTREGAAQMAFNTITEYSPSGATGYTVDGIDNVFDSWFEAYVASQNQVDKIHTAKNDTLAKTVFGLSEGTKTDAFGRTVKTWNVEGEDDPIYVSEAAVSAPVKVYTETVNAGTVAKDFPTGTGNYTYDGTKKITVNGKDSTDAISAANIEKYIGNGMTVEVYATSKKIDKVIVINPEVLTVSRVDTAKNTFVVGGLTISEKTNSDFIDMIGDVAKDDQMVVVRQGTKILSMEPAEIVTGTMTALSSKNVATVDGQTISPVKGKTISSLVGKEVTVVLLNGYAWSVTEGDKAATDSKAGDGYIWVTNVWVEDAGKYDTDKVPYAMGVLADGTVKTLKLANPNSATTVTVTGDNGYTGAPSDAAVATTVGSGAYNTAANKILVVDTTTLGSKMDGGTATPSKFGIGLYAYYTGKGTNADKALLCTPKADTTGTETGLSTSDPTVDSKYVASDVAIVWVSGEGDSLSASVSEREAIASDKTFTYILNDKDRVAVIFVAADAKVSEDTIYVVKTGTQAAYTDKDGKVKQGWSVKAFARGEVESSDMVITENKDTGFYTATANGDAFVLKTVAGKVSERATAMYNGFLTVDATVVNVKEADIVDLRGGDDVISTVDDLEAEVNTNGQNTYVSLLVMSQNGNNLAETVYVMKTQETAKVVEVSDETMTVGADTCRVVKVEETGSFVIPKASAGDQPGSAASPIVITLPGGGKTVAIKDWGDPDTTRGFVCSFAAGSHDSHTIQLTIKKDGTQKYTETATVTVGAKGYFFYVSTAGYDPGTYSWEITCGKAASGSDPAVDCGTLASGQIEILAP